LPFDTIWLNYLMALILDDGRIVPAVNLLKRLHVCTRSKLCNSLPP
jgi:hypothetical protein